MKRANKLALLEKLAQFAAEMTHKQNVSCYTSMKWASCHLYALDLWRIAYRGK